MERRKDSKGRVLKEGESQRKDGRYQYRWMEKNRKRRTIYAVSLKELRLKEQEIQDAMNLGLGLFDEITVSELVNKYVDIHKASVKPQTQEQLNSFARKIENDIIGGYCITEISATAAKSWVAGLYKQGLSYGTINNYKAIMKPAFDMALDDNIILRNPFSFGLSKVIKNQAQEKRPITEDEYARLIAYTRENKRFAGITDIVILLYETGVRVSELCGLTFRDIDLEQNVLQINKQLLKVKGKPRNLQTTKTAKGNRIIPLSPSARESILNLAINRPKLKEEKMVDGHTDFLLISHTGNPRLGNHIEGSMRNLIAAYNRDNPSELLPHITPHTLRHTFCTRLIMSGMNVKTVQYLMGHSTVSVTLNVYSHIRSSADVVKEFREKLPELGCTPTNGLTPHAQELPELTATVGFVHQFDTKFGDLV